MRPEPAADAEDVVADRELADRSAGCLDLSGQLGAEDPLLRSPHAGEHAPEERVGLANVAVCPVDRRGVDPHEHFVVLGYGSLDLFDSQDLRRPVPVVNDRSHRDRPPTVRTTLPVF